MLPVILALGAHARTVCCVYGSVCAYTHTCIHAYTNTYIYIITHTHTHTHKLQPCVWGGGGGGSFEEKKAKKSVPVAEHIVAEADAIVLQTLDFTTTAAPQPLLHLFRIYM